ncbi:response regulator transcription factor [Sansalvadorimonas sp. 2012CJ34-2]|uniref:Response regulator transcription factor n=1 Tax=Parendozoicomonas callyspongiae TaxID=2942213 RepID=A0ABT0PH88_9GAMM|nr:response regulator transcription factor [Sansalvadorimonas sp. 2012CJ34-2]MCL6270621.1 response regulator transcription factor [Sansalvadorimonas sp. 2012CJ34-2]
MNYRIIITEDHPLFCSALSGALQQSWDQIDIAEANNLDDLQRLLKCGETPDLVLLDLHIPGAHGFSALLFLRNQYPDIPVVIISAREEPDVIHKALEHGASGFIPKSSSLETITSAIKQILDGDIWLPADIGPAPEASSVDSEMTERLASLTPQQLKVLEMINSGLRNKQIAWELKVSEATIKAHLTAIFRKLGVNNRTQAVIALQQSELEPEPLDGTA